MKHLFFILALFLSLNLFGQCPPGNVTFSSQADVDQFALDYPNCTTISGDLIIGSTANTSGGVYFNISDLSALSNLSQVTGILYIKKNTPLISLTGLFSLSNVGGLEVSNNDSLTSLSGLSSLVATTGSIFITSNSALISIGLTSLTTVGGTFGINHNGVLNSLSGLSNLTSVSGVLSVNYNLGISTLSGLSSGLTVSTLIIGGNSSLSSLNLPAGFTVNYAVYIKDNASLTSLNGMSSIVLNNSILFIKNNPQLSICSVLSVCNFLASSSFTVIDIQNNAPGCNSEIEVTASCPVPTASLTSAWCGTQLTSFNQMFYSTTLPGASQYEFEFTELDFVGNPTTFVSFSIVNTNSTNLLSASLFNNNAGYNVKVRALVGGVWSSFGAVCQLYSPLNQMTQLTSSHCGGDLLTSNEVFYCYPITNATQYEFEYTELNGAGLPTSNVMTHIRPIPNDNLLWAGVPYVGISYNVRVRTEVNGVWGLYGAVCQLHAQDLPPQTQITVQYCNSQLTTFNQIFNCHGINGATEYEFQFVELGANLMPTGNITTHNRNYFTESLSMASLFSIGTTYSISVRARVNDVWGNFGTACYLTAPQTVPSTQLTSAYCNTALSSIGQSFFCNSVSGATQYRFRIFQQGSGSAPIEYTNSWNNCNLIAAGFSALNTVYDVEVKAFAGGVWGTYGPLCQVISPASIPPTQLNSTWCGGQLTAFNQLFSCDAVSGATEYDFKFIDQNTGTSYSNIRLLPTNRLTLVNSLPLSLGTIYDVFVRAKIGTVWGPFGSICQLTSPLAVPITQLAPSSCNTTLSNIGQTFYCNSVAGAAEYIFRITPSAGTAVDHSRPWHSEKLTWAGFSALNTVYTVQVKARVGNIWGAFGPSCTITTANMLIINDGGGDLNHSKGELMDETLSTNHDNTTLGLHNEKVLSAMNIYPNPASSQITIKNSIENYTVQMMNMNGQVIRLSHNHNGILVVNLEEVSEGLYIIHIYNQMGKKMASQKITVMK